MIFCVVLYTVRIIISFSSYNGLCLYHLYLKHLFVLNRNHVYIYEGAMFFFISNFLYGTNSVNPCEIKVDSVNCIWILLIFCRILWMLLRVKTWKNAINFCYHQTKVTWINYAKFQLVFKWLHCTCLASRPTYLSHNYYFG